MKNKAIRHFGSVAAFAMALSLLLAVPAAAQVTKTGTSQLQVAVAASATLGSVTGTTDFAGATNTNFANYAANTTIIFNVRTSKVGGNGTLTVSFASDWAPATGPSIANDTAFPLTFNCGAVTGTKISNGPTACASAQTVNALTTAFNVLTFPTNSRVTNGSEMMTWSLGNNPDWETGTYTTTATYTLTVN